MANAELEINDIRDYYSFFKDRYNELGNELEKLIAMNDEVVRLLYSRRSLEVIVRDICKTEEIKISDTIPLKGIIDKLNKEQKAPANIITSMLNLNSSSVYGAHPKQFDSGQVRTALINLASVLKWFISYKSLDLTTQPQPLSHSQLFPQTHSQNKKSIIVLPFDNMCSDPEQEYFSDGLTEEIITDLSYIQDLLVISRSSAMTFKNSKQTVKEIAEKVKVTHVLEGSVRKAGNRLRITAQLIEAETDTHLWAEKYEGTLDDIFEIQESVSRQIANSLKLRLSRDEITKISKRPLENIEAYDYYYKARKEMWQSTEVSLNNSLNYIQEAFKIIGENVLLYAALAEIYFIFPHIGAKNPDYYIQKIEESIDKINELDPESEYKHLWRGILLVKQPGMIKESLICLKRSLEINSNNPTAILFFTFLSMQCGKSSLAEGLVGKLIEIDPLNALSYSSLAWYYTMEGQFSKAIPFYKKMVDMEPENAQFAFQYSHALATNNQKEEALVAISNQIERFPDNSWTWLGIFLKTALEQNDYDLGKVVSDDLINTAKFDETYSWFMAECYSLMKKSEEAIKWLENSFNRGFLNYRLLNDYDPFFKSIRNEPRFKLLMQKVKHEWENFEV